MGKMAEAFEAYRDRQRDVNGGRAPDFWDAIRGVHAHRLWTAGLWRCGEVGSADPLSRFTVAISPSPFLSVSPPLLSSAPTSPLPAPPRPRSFAADMAALAQPWLLAELLRFVHGGRAWENALAFSPGVPLPEGFAICALLFLCCSAQALALGQYKWQSRLAGALMRDTAAAVVFGRALMLRAPTAEEVEEIVSLISGDCGAPFYAPLLQPDVLATCLHASRVATHRGSACYPAPPRMAESN